jgi:peptide/nickel transport system permease protein
MGDMGESYAYSTPVLDLVLERLGGHRSAGAAGHAHHRRAGPSGCMPHRATTAGAMGVMGLAQIGIAIPNFWFAILLILLFSVKLQWFSAGGFPGWTKPVAAAR